MAWMETLDRAVEDAGVRDAGAYRVPGFPYLRVDRFSSSLRTQAESGDPAFEAWAARLGALDLAARRFELGNLPATSRESLRIGDANSAASRTQECGALLLREDLADLAQRRALLDRAIVPDDYAPWVRNSGIYALSRGPFSVGVEGWHKEAEEMFRKAASGEGYASNVRRFGAAAPPVSAAEIRAVLGRVATDALGVPHPDQAGIETLFRAMRRSSKSRRPAPTTASAG